MRRQATPSLEPVGLLLTEAVYEEHSDDWRIRELQRCAGKLTGSALQLAEKPDDLGPIDGAAHVRRQAVGYVTSFEKAHPGLTAPQLVELAKLEALAASGSLVELAPKAWRSGKRTYTGRAFIAAPGIDRDDVFSGLLGTPRD